MSTLKISERRTSRAKQTAKYWTKSRMSKAKPIPLRVAPDTLRSSISGTESGRTRVVAPVMPASTEKVAESTIEVPDINKFPFSCVGKLFMREGNSNFVGSAWVIGERAIFTAAHCLYDDNGTFFDDVLFRPRFKDGSSPEQFSVVQMAIDSRYAEFDDDHLKFDLGIAILDRPIADLTGIAGYAVNPTSQIAIGRSVTGVGYPAGSPFDGQRMFQSTGNIVRDSAPGSTVERFFGAENEMTGGSSGGLWIDPSNTVVGLNSFVFVGEDPQVMHSPYFGAGFEDLLEWAEEGGGIATDSEDEASSSPSSIRLLSKSEKKVRKVTSIAGFASLKQCASVEVKDNEICLEIPFIPDLCVELPIPVPDGELAEVCVELKLPNCLRVIVTVLNNQIVDDEFCL